MSRSPRGADRARDAGFTLIEVLVALMVAAMFFEALARGLAMAWHGTRGPAEIVCALAVARVVTVQAASDVGRGEDAAVREGMVERFRYATTVGPFALVPRPSRLAPPPGNPRASRRRVVNDNDLQRITVVVAAPSGRRLRFDSVRLVWPAN
jgi:prepilin-type N-terminal cleavage/methylation domain-containing protein